MIRIERIKIHNNSEPKYLMLDTDDVLHPLRVLSSKEVDDLKMSIEEVRRYEKANKDNPNY